MIPPRPQSCGRLADCYRLCACHSITGSLFGEISMKHVAFLLAGLFRAAPAFAEKAWAEEEPPLHTAVDGTFPPHAMPKLGGGYEGFNIDLAEEIAKRLHRKTVIDAMQFSGIVPA